jgi:hypothetical protein
MGHRPSRRRAKRLTAMEQRIGLSYWLEVDGAPPIIILRTYPPPTPTRCDVPVMPAALPVKQQCFGYPVSTAQGVKLGNPRNMPEAAAKGREAQRTAADQFAANVLPVIESIRATGAKL